MGNQDGEGGMGNHISFTLARDKANPSFLSDLSCISDNFLRVSIRVRVRGWFSVAWLGKVLGYKNLFARCVSLRTF
jgi:hypothetical protein